MSGGFRKLLLATTALVPLGASPVGANPLGASVVAGSATVQGQGTSSVTLTQSTNSAIINWNTFNIGSGEKTAIIQPNATSVQLDRVTGGQGPSQILGSLSSNGRVFLVNPDGILFGKDAQVNVGGLLATTHDISNSDFMAGRYNFNIPGRPDASVVNQGAITAQTGGFAALVAPGVRNTGTITATLGKVGLAAANGFSLDLYGDRLITLQVGDQVAATVKDVATGKPLSSLVGNEGKIRANGGRVELTAAAARRVVDSVINNRGVIEANSIGKHNGMIVLGAATGTRKPTGAPVQVVKVSGKLSTAGKGKGESGGKIQITGESIQLATATLDASGRAGGGKVLVGGDTGGGKLSPTTNAITGAALESTSVPIASHVSVDAASTINVSAIDSGNGGKAILWSDSATRFAGTILARGGAQFGNGGFVETSSHGNLGFSGSVNIAAPKGLPGTLLLDPKDVTIGTSGAWIVTPSAIQNALASGNVIISTAASGTDAGDITVAQDVSWSNGNSLTLSAYRNIAVNANITNTGGAPVNLRADSSGAGVGTVTFGSSAMISTSGTVSIFYNPSVNPAGSVVNGTSYVNPTENFAGHVTGGGQLTAYMLVNSVYDLQNIQNNLSGNYALGKNIDASATAGWNGGAGFTPIGDFGGNGGFIGVFDGMHYTVSNLSINRPTSAYVGLFGLIDVGGRVRNVGVVDASVQGASETGALAGQNNGNVQLAYATGSVNGNGNEVGGLVGANRGGIISQSYAGASVFGPHNYVGGLVGINGGINYGGSTISQSYATGSVSGLGSVGGLAGGNFGFVNDSYATGSVGSNSGFLTGNIVGGLVGYNTGDYGGSINRSYATGSVTGNGNNNVLVGYSFFGNVTSSFYGSNIGQTYPGWDFANVWRLSANANNGYPYLKWQTATPPSPPNTTTLTGQPGTPSTIAIVVAADPETKKYGASDPALTWHIVSGSLAAGDALSGSLNRAAGENVGSYAIGQGTLSLPLNYTLTFLSSVLAVTPATLTYAADPIARTYGSTNPALTGTVTGFVKGDTLATATTGALSFTTNATQSANVGKYAITGSGLTANFGDYVFAQAASNTTALTINPAPLTITANDATRTVGQQNPAFTASYSGFVLGQDKSAVSGLTYSTPANTSSPAGSYPIIPGSASAPNYAISYVAGTLNLMPGASPAPTPPGTMIQTVVGPDVFANGQQNSNFKSAIDWTALELNGLVSPRQNGAVALVERANRNGLGYVYADPEFQSASNSVKELIGAAVDSFMRVYRATGNLQLALDAGAIAYGYVDFRHSLHDYAVIGGAFRNSISLDANARKIASEKIAEGAIKNLGVRSVPGEWDMAKMIARFMMDYEAGFIAAVAQGSRN